LIHPIRETPEWIESIKNKQKEKDLFLDDAKRKNAEYMVWKEGHKNP
jgi:hypothetical protein